MLELQISLGLNDEALDILVRHCSVRFTSDLAADAVSELSPEKQLEAFTSAQLPPDSPTEVKTKLIVVLVNLNASHLVKVTKYFRCFISQSTRQFRSLFLGLV